MIKTELLNLIENFRQEILSRNRAVPKTIVLEQLHQLAMVLVTGNAEMSPGARDVPGQQNLGAARSSKPRQNQLERSSENRNYSMLGMNYNRTLARFNALDDRDSSEGQKLQTSLASQREKIDESGAYSWEGEKPVYHKVAARR